MVFLNYYGLSIKNSFEIFLRTFAGLYLVVSYIVEMPIIVNQIWFSASFLHPTLNPIFYGYFNNQIRDAYIIFLYKISSKKLFKQYKQVQDYKETLRSSMVSNKTNVIRIAPRNNIDMQQD